MGVSGGRGLVRDCIGMKKGVEDRETYVRQGWYYLFPARIRAWLSVWRSEGRIRTGKGI